MTIPYKIDDKRSVWTPIHVTTSLSVFIHITIYSFLVRNNGGSLGLPFVTWYEASYIYGLVPLYAYTDLGHWMLGLQARLPFVPLMMTSLYSAIGIIWSWLVLYKEFLFGGTMDKIEAKRKKQ